VLLAMNRRLILTYPAYDRFRAVISAPPKPGYGRLLPMMDPSATIDRHRPRPVTCQRPLSHDPRRPIRSLIRASCFAVSDLVKRNAMPIAVTQSPITTSKILFSLNRYALTKKTMPTKIDSAPKSRASTFRVIKKARSEFHRTSLDPEPQRATASLSSMREIVPA
jgi:hypothetical protein